MKCKHGKELKYCDPCRIKAWKDSKPGYNNWANMCYIATIGYVAELGIEPEWLGKGGFDRFMEYIGPKPYPEATIDRKDNEKGYFKGNVRWASQAENSHNRGGIHK